VSEVIDKIRTVAALTKEPFFREKYDLYYDEMCE
jgi:ABC-type bacteriocin/lantibiotic exporter with double-glycine peptidase domain